LDFKGEEKVVEPNECIGRACPFPSGLSKGAVFCIYYEWNLLHQKKHPNKETKFEK